MTNTKILLSVFLFLLLLTIFSLNIPFFWDSTFFSGLSVHFYENGMNGFVAPLQNDTGGFPLYSSYLTLMWKCFGKTLTVSHFAMFPFLIGVAVEFFKLAKRFLNDRTIILAMILLLIEPVFMTQAMLMGYDIIIAYFFLLSLNALYSKRTLLYSIALILLCLISIRGIMLASALFIIDILLNRKLDFKFFKQYIPAFLIIVLWTLYHKQQTGWYIFSPTRENNSEQFSGAQMMLRQVVYIIWKSIDLGRIALWIVFVFLGIYALRKKSLPQQKELIRNIFIPFVILSAFMLLIKNPIGHKYFIVVFMLLNIAVCYTIQHLKKSKEIVFVLVCLSLLAGNFIEYPQRYGNAWDSSLKVIPYFKLEDTMRAYIFKANITPDKIGTQFPLTNDLKYSHLSDSSYRFTDIENAPIQTFEYFLYSNIINTNRINELEEIKNNWVVEKELKSGMIQLTLYKNPNF
ncbi:hypothetical protein BH10BAC1_BH10BAC1_15260 [soil metagenome]